VTKIFSPENLFFFLVVLEEIGEKEKEKKV